MNVIGLPCEILEYVATYLDIPSQIKLEQLECLGSEDTPCRLMITHAIESYWTRSQKNTKSSYKFLNFETHFTRDTPSEVA